MAQSTPQGVTNGARAVPTIDLAAFTTKKASASDVQRLEASQDLVAALHSFGFTKVIGHGLIKEEIAEALSWGQKLFALPYEDKIKAPHPPENLPHRGYSGIGKEKVYWHEDLAPGLAADPNAGQELRKISDFKESYEIGSDHDPAQKNIWLPEDVLPGFRAYETSLYYRLLGVSRMLLDVIALGLGLDSDSKKSVDELVFDEGCQLRLLHYPPVSKDKLQKELIARLPAHRDYGAFTLLFQDSNGGLELQDAQTKEYLHAQPEEDAMIVNIGDMLQRWSNDYFVSPMHRVSLPDISTVPESGLVARHSIPFFTVPTFDYVVAPAQIPQFVNEEQPVKYEPISFIKYGEQLTKHQYEGNQSESTD